MQTLPLLLYLWERDVDDDVFHRAPHAVRLAFIMFLTRGFYFFFGFVIEKKNSFYYLLTRFTTRSTNLEIIEPTDTKYLYQKSVMACVEVFTQKTVTYV